MRSHRQKLTRGRDAGCDRAEGTRAAAGRGVARGAPRRAADLARGAPALSSAWQTRRAAPAAGRCQEVSPAWGRPHPHPSGSIPGTGAARVSPRSGALAGEGGTGRAGGVLSASAVPRLSLQPLTHRLRRTRAGRRGCFPERKQPLPPYLRPRGERGPAGGSRAHGWVPRASASPERHAGDGETGPSRLHRSPQPDLAVPVGSSSPARTPAAPGAPSLRGLGVDAPRARGGRSRGRWRGAERLRAPERPSRPPAAPRQAKPLPVSPGRARSRRWGRACCCETRLIGALALPRSGRAFLPSRLLIAKSCLRSRRRFPAIVSQDLQLDAKFSACQPPAQRRGEARAPSLPLQGRARSRLDCCSRPATARSDGQCWPGRDVLLSALPTRPQRSPALASASPEHRGRWHHHQSVAPSP